MEKDEAINRFSRGFAIFMDRKGYALKDVAKILNITEQSVYAFRSGDSLPRFEKVFTLIEHGMKLEEIFGADLAEKLTAGLEPVLVDGKPDAFDTPEFRQGVADAIAALMARGVDKK